MTAARTVRFLLTDGDGGTSNTETETINLTAVNDLSVITIDPTMLTYTGGSAIDIDPVLTVTDVDDNVLVSAEVRLVNGYVQGEDVLVFADKLGITGAFDGATGSLTLTGSATVADYETALRSVQYDNVNSSPTFGVLRTTFTVDDGTGVSSVAIRQLEIIDEDPPRATNDNATVAEGASVLIDLATNDSDNFDALDLASISIVSGPSSGSAMVNGDGTVTYAHDGSETITDKFTYAIKDSSSLWSNVATVSLAITPVNDAPTITPIADQALVEDTATGAIGFTIGDAESAAGILTVTANSSDQTLVPDGNITLSGSGANRTINIMPGVNQSGGPATITVTVNDGTTTSQTTFDVTVAAANDAPVDITLSSGAVNENSSSGTIVGIVSSTDIDAGDSLTFSLTDNAGGRFAVDLNTGQLTVADGNLLNFELNSSHDITVRATDSGGLFYDEAFIVSLNDINDAPIALDDAFSARQLEDLVVPAEGFLANDFDADGDSITVVLVAGPAGGTLTLAADGSFTYASSGSFSGRDQFTYYVTDGTLDSAVATVEIDVVMTFNGANTTAPAENDAATESEAPTETPDYTDSEPADVADSETSDEPANEDSDATTTATISGTAAATTEQVSETFGGGEVSAEMLSQTSAEILVSVSLADIPEARLLDQNSGTQQNGSDDGGVGQAVEFGRFLFARSDAGSSLFPLFSADRVNPDEGDYEQSRDERRSREQVIENVVVGTSAVVSTSVSVGYVMWLLRGGSLLTTFLSSLPAWQAFDPLAVLESFGEQGDEGDEGDDEESLVSLVSGGE